MSDRPLSGAALRIADVQERVIAARDGARENAIAAIRAIEAQLVEALDGENLKGLPNLGNRSDRFYALRVRSNFPNASTNIEGGEEVLVITKEGVLAFARWDDPGTPGIAVIVAPAVLDEQFLLEDVEAVTRAVGWAVDGHVAALARAAEKFERIGAFAARMLAEIGPASRAIAPG